MCHEADLIFPKDANFIISEPVVLVFLRKSEAERLADYIVERHRQKEASKEQENESVDSVELAPLCLLLECFVDVDGLPAFTHPDR